MIGHIIPNNDTDAMSGRSIINDTADIINENNATVA